MRFSSVPRASVPQVARATHSHDPRLTSGGRLGAVPGGSSPPPPGKMAAARRPRDRRAGPSPGGRAEGSTPSRRWSLFWARRVRGSRRRTTWMVYYGSTRGKFPWQPFLAPEELLDTCL